MYRWKCLFCLSTVHVGNFSGKRCLEGKCMDFLIYILSEWFILPLENVSKNRNISNIKSPFFLLIEILRPNLWVVQLKTLDSVRYTTASWASNITKDLLTNTSTAVAKRCRYNISLNCDVVDSANSPPDLPHQ